MSVEISVLGDIKARIDGHDVDLGHVRRQSVFVALLADVNRLVPVDRLIDRVWGRRPPEGARSSLYSYVSRLRSAMSAAGGDAVVNRRPGGYVLSLSDDTLDAVDLHRFRKLTSRRRTPRLPTTPCPSWRRRSRCGGPTRSEPWTARGSTSSGRACGWSASEPNSTATIC